MKISLFVSYLLTVPVLAFFDLLWLGVVAKGFYQDKIGHLLGPVHWLPAVLFYFVYIAGIYYFVIIPNVGMGWQKVAIAGALFGFFIYATYDLTNNATMRDWPPIITVVDIAWGTILSAFIALIAAKVLSLFS